MTRKARKTPRPPSPGLPPVVQPCPGVGQDGWFGHGWWLLGCCAGLVVGVLMPFTWAAAAGFQSLASRLEKNEKVGWWLVLLAAWGFVSVWGGLGRGVVGGAGVAGVCSGPLCVSWGGFTSCPGRLPVEVCVWGVVVLAWCCLPPALCRPRVWLAGTVVHVLGWVHFVSWSVLLWCCVGVS